MASSIVSGYRILWNFEIGRILLKFGSCRGQITGVDYDQKWYFSLEVNIKPILAISCNVPSKTQQALFNNRIAMATIEVTNKQNLYF